MEEIDPSRTLGDSAETGGARDGAPPDDAASVEAAVLAEPGAGDGSAEAPAAKLSAFPLVGIGASAGGLNALQRLFTAMPGDTGMAFVVVVHLSPEHESHLGALLQGHAGMPIVTVKETTKIEPNFVYVIPPGSNLSAVDSHLRLDPQEAERSARAPIDHFFRSLAETHEARAICIVLSGTGSDGALGLKRIKERGGLTIAQEPAEAEYQSMPQNAIATGHVDLVLRIADMPARILNYARSKPAVPEPADDERLNDATRDVVQKIFTQVRAQTGHDFSRYKPSTIMRRIRRRMQIVGVLKLDDYLTFLRERPDEIQNLFRDFLITVTNFFRDPQAFELLEREVVPSLFQGKGPGDQVRAWVVGCASGEEAYSIAILLLEYAMRLDHPPSVHVFASDLSDEALRYGREGFYPDTIAVDVSQARLDRFFTREPGGYRVRKELREVILFTPHNLLKDPPFSRLDLVTCRNVLIYLDRTVQRQLLEYFHYALRPNGYLFLGPSEVVEGGELFRDVSRRHSIYVRQNAAHSHVRLPTVVAPMPERMLSLSFAPSTTQPPASYGLLHMRLLEKHAPPSLLVSSDFNIMYYAEGSGRYLVQPAGEPTNNLLKRVRPELRAELTTVLYRAFEQGEAARTQPVPLLLDGEPRRVAVAVSLAAEPDLRNYGLVAFHESGDLHELAVAVVPDDAAGIVAALQEELDETRRRLQATVEEYETSKEEMRAANEELQSMNEELRSTAEELETSKEELQSINEELVTVNQENKHRVEELGQLTSDLQNLLSSTDIATLFLDRDLCIKRFTPRVTDIFNVLPTDRGRPLAHITHKLNYDGLLPDVERVLRTLVPTEQEVPSEAGRLYFMRLLPYRTVDDRIDGVVLTFVDITERKADEGRLSEDAALLRMALNAGDVGAWAWWPGEGRFVINPPASILGGERQLTDEEYWATVHADDRAASRAAFLRAAEERAPLAVEHRTARADGKLVWRAVRGSFVAGAEGAPAHMVGVSFDVTGLMQRDPPAPGPA